MDTPRISSERYAASSMPRFPARLVSIAVLVLGAWSGVAHAQPAPPAEAPRSAEALETAKNEARVHFEKGVALVRESAWAAALAEFLLSRDLYPTRSATNNAATVLRRLQRFDEALAMFEALLREFPTLPAEDRIEAQRAIAELRGLVGTVEITGAEPGTAIAIDGQARGEYPPLTPIRVNAGAHTVRLFKEGFEPFESRFDVAGGQTAKIAAPLRKLTQSGRLKVAEQNGRELDVVVDNVVVGRTPWEGVVAIGAHTVLLRGKDVVGTQPASAPVDPQKLTTLTLRAEPLESALRVDPLPAGALVSIDAVPVGRGQWVGRLRAGAHRVEVSLDGFITQTRQLNLERGGRELVSVQLKRDPDAGVWKKPSKWVFDLSANALLVPSLGGDLDEGHAVGAGALGLLHASYELGSGFAFGVSGGYLVALQTSDARATTLQPIGNLPAQKGTAHDELRLTGALVGGTFGYGTGERFPFRLRLGAGALIGSVRDLRTGHFKPRSGPAYDTYPVVDHEAARYFYLDPEARLGIRLGKHWEASLGVQLLFLVAISQPKFNERLTLAASTDGIGSYPADKLMGGFVMMVSPGANLRYDF
ncbi:PEGA domain protein [Minicystis rosea]|nr:PEGA domain protein [Minicystis rosea]